MSKFAGHQRPVLYDIDTQTPCSFQKKTQCGRPEHDDEYLRIKCTPPTHLCTSLKTGHLGSHQCVYVFLQFGDCYLGEFRNSMNAVLPTIEYSGGRCLGVTEQIDTVENTWRCRRCIAVMQFDSQFDAELWLRSSPVVKQPDYLGGTDIIILPTISCPPDDKPVFQLMDLTFSSEMNYTSFMDMYVPGHLPGMEESGATNIVASPVPSSYRGNWTSSFLVVNQWPSYERFYCWYNSPEYHENWKKIRHDVAHTRMIIFKLEALVKPTEIPEGAARNEQLFGGLTGLV